MATLDVLDHGRPVGFDDVVKYHGRSSIGGVALGFKAMERAWPLLDGGRPPERYDIEIETAFRGPGARDAFEMVTRAVTGDRYRADDDLPGSGVAPEAPEGRFFFRFGTGGRWSSSSCGRATSTATSSRWSVAPRGRPPRRRASWR